MRSLLLLLAGCGDLLGLDDPQLAVGPGCETGWAYRAQVVVHSEVDADDYQVRIVFDSATEIAASRLRNDAADLRFTLAGDQAPLDYAIESGIGYATTLIWVRIPKLVAGDTLLEMYEGNPNANAQRRSPFVQDIVENPSFELGGAWTGAWTGGSAQEQLAPAAWATDGAMVLSFDVYAEGERSADTYAEVHQSTVFPPGSDYVIRFDVDVLALSHGAVGGLNNGALSFSFSPGFDDVFQLSGTGPDVNPTGPRLGVETYPFSSTNEPLTIRASVAPGDDTGYVKTLVDNLRVRRHVDPEPNAANGEFLSTCNK